jgi:tRNA A-37 threonylcarbamoyl transferase component Bud32
MSQLANYLRSVPEVVVQYCSSVIPLTDPEFQNRRMLIRSFRSISESDSFWLRQMIIGSTVLGGMTAVSGLIFLLTLLPWAQWHIPYANLPSSLLLLLSLAALAISLLLLCYSCWKNRHTFIPISAIGISSDGLTTYHGSLALGFNKHLPWKSITDIRISHDFPPQQKQKKEALIKVSSIGEKDLRLRLSAICSIEERKLLVESFKAYARRATDPEDLARMVRVSDVQDIPFTQLWSEALRSSLPRGSCSVLQSSTLLQQGRFFIKKQIGGGGQGAIYLAEMLDESDEKIDVALKEYILPDQEHLFDRKRAVEQFEREVHLLARLKHSNLARLIDAFIEDHRGYLVLEYLRGQNLREIVKSSGKLTPELTCKITLQLCDVLSYLHDLTPPVVHLDVSPENVIRLPDGSVKLIDFNTSSDGSGLRTKLIAGKQRYMPPEQYRNEIGPQCDIYSLGCTMFFMLTGIEPEPLTVLHPKEKIPDLPAVFDEIVSAATSLSRESRTKTIEELRSRITSPEVQYITANRS